MSEVKSGEKLVTPATVLAPYLEQGETLLWSARPLQGMRMMARGVLWFVIGGVFVAFAVFWFLAIFSVSIVVSLVALLPLAVGIYVAFGQFWVDAQNRRKTTYGLSDRRILVAGGFPKPALRSFALWSNTRVDVVEQPNGTAEILIGEPDIRSSSGRMSRSRDYRPRIYPASDAQQVCEHMRQQIAFVLAKDAKAKAALSHPPA